MLEGDSLIDDHSESTIGGLASGPLQRVSSLNWDKLLSDWEVDQIEIKVVDTEVSLGLLAGKPDMLWLVEGVTQLGDSEEILALTELVI